MRLRLALLALVSEGLYLFWTARSRLPVDAAWLASWYRPALFEETLEFLGSFALLFLLYALAVRSSAQASGRGVAIFIFVTSALFRVTLAVSGRFETTTSPAFLTVAPLTSSLDELLSRLPVTPGAARAALGIGADLFALALTPGLLRAAKLPSGLALILGWNPLLVKEAAATPRTELLLGLAALLLAVRLLQGSRPTLSALVAGLSLGAWPALAASLPALAKALGARVLFTLAVALGIGAALLSSASWPGALGWPPGDTVGGSLLPSLAALLRLLLTRDPDAPRLVAVAIWLAVALRSLRGLKPDGSNLPRALCPAVGSLLLLLPQARPWSFLPLAYLAPYSANRAWIGLTATAPLIYLALGGGEWSFWLGFAQYFLPTASLVFVWLGGKGDGR